MLASILSHSPPPPDAPTPSPLPPPLAPHTPHFPNTPSSRSPSLPPTTPLPIGERWLNVCSLDLDRRDLVVGADQPAPDVRPYARCSPSLGRCRPGGRGGASTVDLKRVWVERERARHRCCVVLAVARKSARAKGRLR